MKLGLIGANGNVGTELCFLLKNDVDLKPIIRNRLGSVFLKHHGFPCLIADISQKKDAKECLSDIDAVVISSYATDPFSGSQTQSSQKINEQIIKNSVKFSDKDATIIYFSTIRAFSHKIDPNTSHFWTRPGYDKEKKHLERVFMAECRKNKKRGFALRLGHVFGDNQPKTKEFKKIFSKKRISVRVSPDEKSNVIHVVSIKDAIMRCLDLKVKPNVYSVVNNPQWTWQDVFNYYKKSEAVIEYKPLQTSTSNPNSFFWKLLKSNKKHLSPIRYYLPSKFDAEIQKKLTMKKMMQAISSLKNEEAFYSIGFGYEPIPGPFLPNLNNTKELLKNYNLEIFQ
jgi:dTDP-4-dehydrorhamnose reductase